MYIQMTKMFKDMRAKLKAYREKNVLLTQQDISISDNYDKIQDFLNDFSDPARADVNIVSIGCSGREDQQVYPEVFREAERRPEIKFKIDLFDNFYCGYNNNRTGKPDIVLNHPTDWLEDNTKQSTYSSFVFTHRKFTNISLRANNLYFPDKFHANYAQSTKQQLLEAVKKHLTMNNKVIFSCHTGNNWINPFVIHVFNRINQERFSNYQKLFVFGQNYRPFNHRADVFNQTLIDEHEQRRADIYPLIRKIIPNPDKWKGIIKTFNEDVEEQIQAQGTSDFKELSPTTNSLYEKSKEYEHTKSSSPDQEHPIITYFKNRKVNYKSVLMEELSFDVSDITVKPINKLRVI